MLRQFSRALHTVRFDPRDQLVIGISHTNNKCTGKYLEKILHKIRERANPDQRISYIVSSNKPFLKVCQLLAGTSFDLIDADRQIHKQWYRDNKPLLKSLAPIVLDDYAQSKGGEDSAEYIQNLRESDLMFRQSFNNIADEFINRLRRRNMMIDTEKEPQVRKLSEEYILYECVSLRQCWGKSIHDEIESKKFRGKIKIFYPSMGKILDQNVYDLFFKSTDGAVQFIPKKKRRLNLENWRT